MAYDFENITINQNIKTFSVFHVSKMPDIFLDVEFKYPRCSAWKTCVPIFEKYQGINFKEAPLTDVKDWIIKCYDDMNPENYKTWNKNAEKFWEEHTNAGQTKDLFDVLNNDDQQHRTQWYCRQCTDVSKVNSQAASRIRSLKKDGGYHIATKVLYCENCNRSTPHDMLLRISPKIGGGQDRYPIPRSVLNRVKKMFDYTDACFGRKDPEGTSNWVADHKFPSTRWVKGEKPNFPSMSDDEIRNKFQLLTNQTNLQKERYCNRCLEKGIRGDFFGIKWYPVGDEKWRGANDADEQGCVGCPWYDLVEWKKEFNEFLDKHKEEK